MAKGVNIPLTISGLRQAREDLEKLNDEFEKVKDDPIQSKKIAKEFNDLSKAVDGATEELIKMNAAGKLAGTRFDDLNEVLFQTKEEVLPLTSQIGEMEDRMYQLAAAGDTSSKEFKALQSETVRLRKVIIETDRSIDTMAENAGSLGGVTSAFGELGDAVLNLDFKRAGVALKGLGTQFKAFGATLKANPIFLIVSIIAAVVTAVIALKDNVKFLGATFDFFADIIGEAIQNLKDFLDFIGASNFKTKELLTNFEKVIEKEKEQIGIKVKGYERSIALAQAEGRNTEEMEKRKQKAIIEASNEQIKKLKTVIKWKMLLGELDEEETKRIKGLVKAEIEARQEAEHQIKLIDATAKRESVANTEAEIKEKKEAYNNYVNFRRDAARMIQDLELELMEEGLAKEILQNEIKFQRLREDTLRNTNLTEEEKQKAISAYNELEKKARFELEMTTADGLLDINNDYEERVKASMQRITTFSESEASKRIARSKAEKEALLSDIQSYSEGGIASLNALNNLANVVSENRLKKVKEGSKAEEKIRKQMFIRQKALNLAMAAIDGFKAITASLAQAPIAIGAVPNPAGIASLAFAIAQTGASIAAIAAQRFEGGGSTPSASTPSIGGGGGAQSASASTPSFELFGDPNDLNNVQGADSVETNQTITVNAVVSESEVTNTQNKVAKMQKNAEL